MLYTDLREIKKYLEIDPANTAEDWKLLTLIEQASQLIEEVIGRAPDYVAYNVNRVEFYQGTGTQKLLLKGRPAYAGPATLPYIGTVQQIQVFIDENGYYGQASGSFDPTTSALTAGADFFLKVDQPDGITSRCAILVRVNDYWPKPYVRQQGLLTPFLADDTGSVKVIYSGGYSVDTLPASWRMAANLLVSKLRYIFPLGLELGSESYEERSISLQANQKSYLLGLVKPMLWNYRDWKW